MRPRARARAREKAARGRERRGKKEQKNISYLRVSVEDVEVHAGEVGREHPVDGVAAAAADADDLVSFEREEEREEVEKRESESVEVDGGVVFRKKINGRWVFLERGKKRFAVVLPSCITLCFIFLARWIQNVDVHR